MTFSAPAEETVAPRSADHQDPFEIAVRRIAARVNATVVDEAGTPISQFKASYATVLDRVNAGDVKIVRRGRRRYLLLGEEQAQALVMAEADTRTLAEAFADLPTLPATAPRLRAATVPEASDQYRLSR